MSMMICHYCNALTDTDDDPDSLYVSGHDCKCVCCFCREDRDLPSEFEKEATE